MATKAKQTKTETPFDPPATGALSVGEVVETDEAPVPAVNEGIEPGSPEFDWNAEYPGEPVFVFTASDGTTVGMAALVGERKPKAGFLRRLRKRDELEQMFTVLELVSSAAALAVSDEFEDEDYAEMYQDWAEWSRTSVGESVR